tara:strand:- start:507 stop:1082 length:576 start_codon:yes stop_codon:yes gene_type:complete
MDDLTIYNDQLKRMRGMNKFYHQQFLIDVRIFLLLATVLIVLSFDNRDIAYLIPLVSLFGSVILAFHAYYLIFSRHYSEFLEKKINKKLDKELIITHKLENSYFFPINDKKIVVAKIGKNFSWFSFVTLLITAYGIASYSYGVYVISYYLSNNVYLYLLALLTLITIIIGYWWFIKNIGEERLSKSYEQQI